MPHASSFPDHPSRRRSNAPLDGAFDRIVREDRLLSGLAARHWLHRDLRVTFLTVLGPPLVWLVGGLLLPATVTAGGFAALLVLCLRTASAHGLQDASRLLTAVRWIAVAMAAVAVLVIWNAPTGGSATGPRPGSAQPTVTNPVNGAHYRATSPSTP